jgi:hypothetical protein
MRAIQIQWKQAAASEPLVGGSFARSISIVVAVLIGVVAMIIVVTARHAISNHGTRDRANRAADYAARDSAAHKSRLISHSGTSESKHRRRNTG